MKTTYQKPETEMILVTTGQLMIGSTIENSIINPDDAPETSETSGNLSRGSIWDED